MAELTPKDIDKILHVLRKYYENSRDGKMLLEIVEFSHFVFINHWNQKSFENLFNLEIYLDHEVFLKYVEFKKSISDIIKHDLQNISKLLIDRINIYPDYENLEIINNRIKAVFTPWEEINIEQNKLLGQLEKNNKNLDLQNIGNSSRLILQKLANIVFQPAKHTPKDIIIDVGEAKFKNRLHSYIKIELGGEETKELRKFAESSIQTVEDAIDLANTLTHKLDPERTIAEVCVIGTLSTISIIKFVFNRVREIYAL